jgi:hypothetical protein
MTRCRLVERASQCVPIMIRRLPNLALFGHAGVACRRPFPKAQQTLAGPCGKIPWRDVGFQVASRHGRTTCNPQQRCGNSLALSWIACSENLEGHPL